MSVDLDPWDPRRPPPCPGCQLRSAAVFLGICTVCKALLPGPLANRLAHANATVRRKPDDAAAAVAYQGHAAEAIALLRCGPKAAAVEVPC